MDLVHNSYIEHIIIEETPKYYRKYINDKLVDNKKVHRFFAFSAMAKV